VGRGLVGKGLGTRLYWLGMVFIVGLCISVYNIWDTVLQSLYIRGRICIWKVLFENNALLFYIVW
jgi:hypothetical protein